MRYNQPVDGRFHKNYLACTVRPAENNCPASSVCAAFLKSWTCTNVFSVSPRIVYFIVNDFSGVLEEKYPLVMS